MKKLNIKDALFFFFKHTGGILMVKTLIILTIFIMDLVTTKNSPIQVEATFNVGFNIFSFINLASIYIYVIAVIAISIRDFVVKKLSIN